MRFWIGIIVKLVGKNCIGGLPRDPLCHHHVIVRMIWRNSRWRHDHLGAECLEQPNFFLRHLVRHGEDALVASQRRGNGETDARVSAGAFDDCPARLQLSISLRALDDRQTDSIFD